MASEKLAARETTLVVADDDPDFREVLEVWFSTHSEWRVRLATNGAEALERICPAVRAVVLDREMPILTGPEVVDRLEDVGFDGEVIIVSGRPPDSRVDEARVASYLTKPVRRDDLFAAVDRVLA
jgi:CheY-like chemotaxis protein